jgi:DNA-binding FadR family transcriptional regulator
MSGVVVGALLISFRATSRLPGSARASLPKHRAILEAIRRGHASGAARSMRRLVHSTSREIEAFSKRPAARRARPRE